jgi:tetratricopeptide (TPR) repeat protein
MLTAIRNRSVRGVAALLVFASLVGCVAMTSAPSKTTRVAPSAAAAQPAKAPSVEQVVDAQWQQAYDHALGLLKAERYADAERELKALIQREPKFAGPYANLGILYRRSGRSADAIKALDKAIDLNPRPAYYNELAMVHRAEGRFDEAERSYERALALDPNYAYAHLNLGILYDLYLQAPDKALPHYERYQALVPSEGGTITKWIADLKRRATGTAEQAKGGQSG